MDLLSLTIHEALDLLKKKEITSVELTQAYLDRIAAIDDKINAYVIVTQESALDRAGEADRMLMKGVDDGALLGIPIAIKDIFCTEGIPTTCCSRILKNFIPPYSATAVEKLTGAGAVILGKTNMDEFAMGSSTETSCIGPTRNPWDSGRVPGGSSGGSAAAVAADECMASIGTDTGGSIRQPAGLCSVVGIKPTYGRVSRYGMIAYASSLDQGGPITKDVIDCAIVLKAISGRDPRDSTTAEVMVPDYVSLLKGDVSLIKGDVSLIKGDVSLLKGDLKGMRLGIPGEYFIDGMDAEILKAVEEAINVFEGLGGRRVPISLPHTEFAVATYYIVASAEASSNLARYDGVKYGFRAEGAQDLMDMYSKTRSLGFGAEVKRRIMLGTYALSSGYYDAYYLKALKVRSLLKSDFDRAFKECDIIITPTSPTPAFKLGEKLNDPLTMYLSDIFTISCNLAGLPGISIPCGFSSNGLPIGLQIMGRPFDEETILKAAFGYEQNTEWHKRKPEIGHK